MKTAMPANQFGGKSNWVIGLMAVAALSSGNLLKDCESVAAAAEPEARGSGSYLVVPTTTKLQRYYFRNFEDLDAFVFINAMDPVSEDGTTLDAAAIDLDSLQESLTPYCESPSPGRVVFSIRTRREPQRAIAAGMLSRALGQFGREFGLRESELDFRRYGEENKYFNNWNGLVEDLAKPPSASEIEAESEVSDGQVAVFAAHTPLSRTLYGGEFGYPVDCVVFIIPPIEEADAGKILPALQRSVSQLKLKGKNRVLVQYHSNNWDGTETKLAVKEFTSETIWKELLGFETYMWGIWSPSPMQVLKAHRQAAQTRADD